MKRVWVVYLQKAIIENRPIKRLQSRLNFVICCSTLTQISITGSLRSKLIIKNSKSLDSSKFSEIFIFYYYESSSPLRWEYYSKFGYNIISSRGLVTGVMLIFLNIRSRQRNLCSNTSNFVFLYQQTKDEEIKTQ